MYRYLSVIFIEISLHHKFKIDWENERNTEKKKHNLFDVHSFSCEPAFEIFSVLQIGLYNY